MRRTVKCNSKLVESDQRPCSLAAERAQKGWPKSVARTEAGHLEARTATLGAVPEPAETVVMPEAAELRPRSTKARRGSLG